ncbi:uncharacterized protein LOC105642100 [Jatropha curcas]|uniref:uncharacterized protein LOC105642100 n=1 Tax=Jatropha curcas TaxID=180498 RepID=UPI0005FB581F|nr:uncharacterized protein LOC105642100 [Jatropha curcas]
MIIFTLKSQFHLIGYTNLTNPAPKSPVLIPIKTKSNLKYPTIPSKSTVPRKLGQYPQKLTKSIISEDKGLSHQISPNGNFRFVVVGAVSVGLFLFLMGFDEHKALAFGPEGPLVEEFWENVRRYALYALTVSTGALYTILQPIVELLKNPISAVLVILIFGGSFYIVSQVLSAMVGVTEFTYDYGY